jgi:hypothetical protein
LQTGLEACAIAQEPQACTVAFRVELKEACLQILSAIDGGQVVIVAGETGCGKTTQVPQMILDASTAAGRTCRVLCSQPRRISAVSVASRVAAERGEGVGRTVGFSIRLESSASKDTAILFVTTGVLCCGYRCTAMRACPGSGSGGLNQSSTTRAGRAAGANSLAALTPEGLPEQC